MVAPSNLLQAKKLPFSSAIQLISITVPCSIKQAINELNGLGYGTQDGVNFSSIGEVIRKLIEEDTKALLEVLKKK